MSWKAGGHPGIIRAKLTKESDALLSRLAASKPVTTLAKELGTTPYAIIRLLDGGTASEEYVRRIEAALASLKKAS